MVIVAQQCKYMPWHRTVHVKVVKMVKFYFKCTFTKKSIPALKLYCLQLSFTWRWARHINCFFCKTGLIIVPNSHSSSWELNEIHHTKSLIQWRVHGKYLICVSLLPQRTFRAISHRPHTTLWVFTDKETEAQRITMSSQVNGATANQMLCPWETSCPLHLLIWWSKASALNLAMFQFSIRAVKKEI